MFGPVALSAAAYLRGDRRGNWQTADRSSAGLLGSPSGSPNASIRVYAARDGEASSPFTPGSSSMSAALLVTRVLRLHGLGRAHRRLCSRRTMVRRATQNGAKRRWRSGRNAHSEDPRGRRELQFSSYGDYRPWPGPNSNTFVEAALDPEVKAALPPTARGKDYPYRGRPVRSDAFPNRAIWAATSD
jgi:hypothetical protein